MEPLFDHLSDRASALGGAEAPIVLNKRPDAMVVRAGSVVVKAHRAVDAAAFGDRVAVVATELDGIFAPPVGTSPWFWTWHDWLVTAWPAGKPVDPEEPWAAPWSEAGQLLARLHRHRSERRIPPAGTVERITKAIAELAASDVSRAESGRAVLDAADGLGDLADSGTSLIHGDFHLGQLAEFSELGWRLLDPDDLGTGDPLWDFARPASWFAVGLIGREEWSEFVESYRAAGGNAIREWADIDWFARTFTVHAASRALVKAAAEQRPTTDAEREFVAACARIR